MYSKMSILYSEIYKIAISVRGEEMYKVTEMNNDEIMWQLIRSELGFILLGEDGADAFSVLAKKWNMERQTTYKWQQISDNVLLFPILYKQDPQPHDFSDLIETKPTYDDDKNHKNHLAPIVGGAGYGHGYTCCFIPQTDTSGSDSDIPFKDGSISSQSQKTMNKHQK